MDGLATIRQREAELANAEPLKVPNERVRQIIVGLMENIDTFTSVHGWAKDSDFAYHVELATFRGAFLALAWSKDPDAQRFAEKGLLAFNSGGRKGLKAALKTLEKEEV